MNAIKITNLNKKYTNFELKIDNLEIESGRIIGIVGENGAGKTTLIKSILGIIKPEYEEIKIFDKDINTNEKEIKENIGVVLDNMYFPEILSPKDINTIMKDIYKSWNTETFNKYMNEFNIPLNKQIKDLSKGMRKKLEIATSLTHHPKLLILDEPTSGLDPIIRNEVLEIFQDFIKDEEHTIILSTHITSDLEHIADTIIFIDNGQIKLNELKDEIIDNYGILKCNLEDITKIDKEDIITKRKNKYNYEILIKDKSKLSKKYKNYIIDKITIEDLMLLMIKGEE